MGRFCVNALKKQKPDKTGYFLYYIYSVKIQRALGYFIERSLFISKRNIIPLLSEVEKSFLYIEHIITPVLALVKTYGKKSTKKMQKRAKNRSFLVIYLRQVVFYIENCACVVRYFSVTSVSDTPNEAFSFGDIVYR